MEFLFSPHLSYLCFYTPHSPVLKSSLVSRGATTAEHKSYIGCFMGEMNFLELGERPVATAVCALIHTVCSETAGRVISCQVGSRSPPCLYAHP